ADAVLPHEPLDPLVIQGPLRGTQGLRDPGASIGALRPPVDLANPHRQLPVLPDSLTLRPIQPRVDPAPRDSQNPTHRADRKLTPMIPHEREPRFGGSAKYTAAFF